MQSITTIGFDADDTLWQSEQFFHLTHAHVSELLADFAEPEMLAKSLLEAEKRNLRIYGYGVKGFTLSMIETAIEITNGKVPATTIHAILQAGREMLRHPIEPLPHAHETLQKLANSHRLILITKGDLFDQERKLAQSGLGELFHGIEIVSEKRADTYTRIFAHYGDGAEHSMMVGNSIKSDILPAIAAGGIGVYVPHALTWAMEHAAEPENEPRYKRIAHLGELPGLIGS